MRRATFLLLALALCGGASAEDRIFDAAAVDLGGLEARSAALMLSGQQGGDLEVAVVAIPAPPQEPGGTSSTLLVVDLSGPPLLAAFGGADDRLLELYAYALDESGALRATLTRAVDLDLPDLDDRDDRLAAAGVKFFGHLDLPAGEVSLRVLALHRSSGRFGLRTVRLVVPSRSGGEPPALPPVHREPAGDWILVREAGREPPPFPLDSGGRPLVPWAARRVAESAPAATPAPIVRPAPRRDADRRIGEAYRAVAATLAAGDEEESRQRLTDLHAAELGSGTTEERQRLLEAELLAGAALAAIRGEALLPLVDLHLELHRHHHRARRYGLATHARQVGLALADLYLARSSAADAQELVAAVLVELAVYLEDAGDSPMAEMVHERALEVHPNHPAALIGLGAIQQSWGKLGRAAEMFGRLVELEPADPEARLRHAVAFGRSGRSAEAEEALRTLLEMPGRPPWIEVVAAQELAGLLTARGERERAVGVLEAALEEHPEQGRLRIQLGALHDRSGRPRETRAVLAPLDAADGDGGPTPRWIYAERPRERAERDRRRLAAAVEERREDLRAAAAAVPAEEGR